MLLMRLLVVLAAGGFGGFVLWDAVNALRRAHASRGWPVAPGVVTDVDLRLRGALKSGGGLWEVRVAYDYWIDGCRYAGRQLYFTSRPVVGVCWTQAEAMRDRYARGTRAPVHYDPRRPEEAVLEPRVDWAELAGNAAMGTIPLIGVGWALLDLFGLADF